MSRKTRACSIHVQLRWLERFRGFNLDHIRAEMETAKWNGFDEHSIYNYLRTRRGIDFNQIINEIYTDHVHRLVQLGATSIPLIGPYHGFSLKVVYKSNGDPKITTVLINCGTNITKLHRVRQA
jgi:hypothetical protein